MKKFYLGFLIILSGYTLANMRAPMRMAEGSSSFLNTVSSSSVAKSLEVQKERLSIDCSYTHCDVDAVYYIAAKESQSLQFEFILPAEVAVTANVNGLESVATLSMTYYDISGGAAEVVGGRQLYRAVFSGQLSTGDNFIQVRYQQKLGLFERDYGYFVDSRFVERFTYALEPLKEWQLAPNFRMDITLSTPRSRPDRDGWSLFKRRTVSCELDGGEVVKKGDKVVYNNQLSKDFPPELLCNMGDSDLVHRRRF